MIASYIAMYSITVLQGHNTGVDLRGGAKPSSGSLISSESSSGSGGAAP